MAAWLRIRRLWVRSSVAANFFVSLDDNSNPIDGHRWSIDAHRKKLRWPSVGHRWPIGWTIDGIEWSLSTGNESDLLLRFLRKLFVGMYLRVPADVIHVCLLKKCVFCYFKAFRAAMKYTFKKSSIVMPLILFSMIYHSTKFYVLSGMGNVRSNCKSFEK